MRQQVFKRYSKAFKLQVVREYEAGASLHELRQKYGIGGGNTVREWVEKYSRQAVRHKMMVMQSPGEQEQVKGLKQRVAQLEKVVAQLTLEKLMLESSLEVAEEELGLSLKKSGGLRSFNAPISAVRGKQE